MLGNDIVDLGDSETFVSAQHPRFDARVFSDRERLAIEQSAMSNELRWAFWAAKESAYKLMRRMDRSIFFSPQAFSVRLEEDAFGYFGSVAFAEDFFPVRIARIVPQAGAASGVALHAMCTLRALAANSWFAGVAEIETLRDAQELALSASVAVRRLAQRTAAKMFQIDPTRIRVERDEDRVPYFDCADADLDVSLSLAHHGRFVAFSCTAPTLNLVDGRAA